MESLKQFRNTLENKTAKDIIGDNFKLIDIGSQENVLKALETLQKHNLSSLPVFYENTHNYFGSISLQDLAVVIYVLAVSKSFVDLFAEEIVEWKEYDNQEFKLFAEEKIEEFVNASERNSWGIVKKNTPVLEIMKILSNPAQNQEEKGKTNIVRVGVEDENGKLAGVISQYGLVEYLVKEINSHKNLFDGLKINDLFKKTNEELFTINESDVACDGFRLMLEKQISGVGVVNEKGQLTSVFSSHDIKRVNLEENLFKDFRLTVKEYLSKSKRYFEKEVNEDSVVLHKDDTFLHLLEKIEKFHLHSIFSVDENKIPIKVISLCDIIKSLLN